MSPNLLLRSEHAALWLAQMFLELHKDFAVLFVILLVSAGCVEESMDIFHAIALHQPMPCALEE